jgi:hypothetical protein
VVCVWAYLVEPRDEIISVRLLTCLLNEFLLHFRGFVFPFRANQSILYVLKNGIVEQEWLLLD